MTAQRLLPPSFYLLVLLLSSLNLNAQTVTDIDGNVYPVVSIGSQKWMGMNLRTTRFSDGSPITNAGYNNWYYIPLSEPRYAEPLIPPNTTDTLALGYWYNYPAAGDPRNICPQGWHVATDADWHKMVKYLDPNADTSSLVTLESSIAGGMLKDTAMWISPNAGATNSTGFSAIPVSDISGSIVWPAGHVCCQGMNASFWCGGPAWVPGTTCYYRYLDYMQPVISRNTDNYSNGKSIRCVCDTLTTTSVQEYLPNDQLNLCPNPATDWIRISSKAGQLGRILIFDQLGTLVVEETSAADSKNIDISSFADGIYLIVLTQYAKSIRFVKTGS